jgi:hypothetical protein
MVTGERRNAYAVQSHNGKEGSCSYDPSGFTLTMFVQIPISKFNPVSGVFAIDCKNLGIPELLVAIYT